MGETRQCKVFQWALKTPNFTQFARIGCINSSTSRNKILLLLLLLLLLLILFLLVFLLYITINTVTVVIDIYSCVYVAMVYTIAGILLLPYYT